VAALALPAIVTLACLAAAPAEGAVVDVAVGGTGLVFTPAVVTIQAGDSVRFTNTGGFHDVKADDGSFRCSQGCDGEGGDGAPSGNPWSFVRTFSQPGTFLYHCEEHGGPGGVGMSGRIVVQAGGPAPCVAGPVTLCLGAGGRFKAEVVWSSGGYGGGGDAVAVPLPGAPQSGLFYFIDPTNIEMLVKVVNACNPALGNHFWVFYAATTNLQFTLNVTDTQTGQVRTYTNELNHAASPVQDTNAFATCP
jgi:plastocyanin